MHAHVLLLHAKVVAAVLHQLVILAERARVGQHLQPLARRQLALGVLRVDALLAAAQQRLRADVVELGLRGGVDRGGEVGVGWGRAVVVGERQSRATYKPALPRTQPPSAAATPSRCPSSCASQSCMTLEAHLKLLEDLGGRRRLGDVDLGRRVRAGRGQRRRRGGDGRRGRGRHAARALHGYGWVRRGGDAGVGERGAEFGGSAGGSVSERRRRRALAQPAGATACAGNAETWHRSLAVHRRWYASVCARRLLRAARAGVASSFGGPPSQT